MNVSVKVPYKPEIRGGYYKFLVTELYRVNDTDLYVNYHTTFPANEVNIKQEEDEYLIDVQMNPNGSPLDVMVYPQ